MQLLIFLKWYVLYKVQCNSYGQCITKTIYALHGGTLCYTLYWKMRHRCQQTATEYCALKLVSNYYWVNYQYGRYKFIRQTVLKLSELKLSELNTNLPFSTLLCMRTGALKSTVLIPSAEEVPPKPSTVTAWVIAAGIGFAWSRLDSVCSYKAQSSNSLFNKHVLNCVMTHCNISAITSALLSSTQLTIEQAADTYI
jgi:hypothetical protein